MNFNRFCHPMTVLNYFKHSRQQLENLEVPDGHKFKILVVKLGKDNKADSAPLLIKKGVICALNNNFVKINAI